jgi:rubredoxin
MPGAIRDGADGGVDPNRETTVTSMDSYLCPECSYVYDEELGDTSEGFEPGTSWDDIPVDFFCPDCGIVPKYDFVVAS